MDFLRRRPQVTGAHLSGDCPSKINAHPRFDRAARAADQP
jgi:hypothetical protein